MMHALLYTSRALIADTPAEHEDILLSCRRNNAGAGVTGFLHREGAHFIQYLEGPKAALQATFERIRQDPRHTDIALRAEEEIGVARLPDWQMGFSDGSTVALSDVLTLPKAGEALVVDDPFDLVVFMVANAGLLRDSVQAA